MATGYASKGEAFHHPPERPTCYGRRLSAAGTPDAPWAAVQTERAGRNAALVVHGTGHGADRTLVAEGGWCH